MTSPAAVIAHDLMDEPADASDAARVRELLGREPQGTYRVVARDDGDPVVIENAPLLADGTPMPTRYWLVGADAVTRVSRLEADGGVRAAEATVDPDDLAAAHRRYASERDAALAPDHTGPAPSGGVGGTRTGVKCLHAHYAWYLAGGDDPVGRWVADRLDEEERSIEVLLGAESLEVRSAAGWAESLPAGLTLLARGGLDAHDPPAPEDLTNALGTVEDALAELVRRHPALRGDVSVTLTGALARSIACVEAGASEVAADFVLARDAAEDVFRTVVTEASADRAHNPGLPRAHVADVVPAACVTVAVIRNLGIDHVTIDGSTSGATSDPTSDPE